MSPGRRKQERHKTPKGAGNKYLGPKLHLQAENEIIDRSVRVDNKRKRAAMSDESQGPGWWLASNGKWYSPEQAAGPPPIPPAPSNTKSTDDEPGSVKPWWKKKKFNIPLGILAAGILINIVSPAEDVATDEVAPVSIDELDDAIPIDESPAISTQEPDSDPTAASEPTLAPGPTQTPDPTADTTSEVVTVAQSDLRALAEGSGLPVAAAYVRYDYQGNGWSDFDGDCRSTRHDVLAAESLIEPTFTEDGCFVESGLWVDPWSGEEMTDASDATIDHMIALNEAHDSGAWEWDTDTKSRFTNYMDPAALNVVTQSTNSSKGRRSPADWRPPQESTWCGYAIDWVRVKHAWQLGVTSSERDALRDMLGTCTEQSSSGPRVETLAVVAGVPLVVFAVPTPVP